MNVSDYILSTLGATGIETIFGLPGVHALGLWESLSRSNLRYIGFRHEQSAAHAADGYGRASRRAGVVLLSTGPGALNALSALAEAYVSSSPVIAISSAIPTQYLGKQKGYLHETKDLKGAFEAVTRFHGRATSPDDVPPLLADALEAATGRRPGPAFIEIPADVIDGDVRTTGSVQPQQTSQQDPLPMKTPTSAYASSIEEAALLSRLAARPVIWAGGGVLRSGASAELQRLAEMLGAPVVTTFMGKGAIAEDHPLSVGSLVRQPETAELLGDADLMIAVGTRFTAMATGNWTMRMPDQMIHIDIDPDEIGRNYPVRIGISEDAKVALAHLIQAISASQDPPVADKRWSAKVVEVKTAALTRASEHTWETQVLSAIRRAVPAEVTTVHDMTVPSYWAAPFFPVTVPGTYHYPYGYASLGFSFPAAIGVAAHEQRPVVAFSGDGGFQYHLRELATLVQYSLPVTVIVFNDQSWGVLRAFSQARYGESFGLDLPSPDMLGLAKSYGVNAVRVSEPTDIERAVKDAVSSCEPNLIEIPGKWALPPPSG
ncbi:MAG: thiamine pyrophosphate-binding protein, partial [Actinobacteria bacterium]|nr:thiamine pyrophosphate-binding protein [Actinomycetota bacterium]